MTTADVWSIESECRTDGAQEHIDSMPYIRFPYPGQWGGLRFEAYAISPCSVVCSQD